MPLRELPVQRVGGRLAQRIAVDILDRLEQFRGVEQRALDPLRIALQPLVGAEARAGRPAQLPADRLLLGHDQLDALAAPGHGAASCRGSAGVSGAHCGRLQDGELRLGDAVAVPVHPGQRVVALGGAQVDQHPVRRLPGAG